MDASVEWRPHRHTTRNELSIAYTHLDVAVHVALAMEVLEPLEELPHDDGDGRLLDGAQRTNLWQRDERCAAMDRSHQSIAGEAVSEVRTTSRTEPPARNSYGGGVRAADG